MRQFSLNNIKILRNRIKEFIELNQDKFIEGDADLFLSCSKGFPNNDYSELVQIATYLGLIPRHYDIFYQYQRFLQKNYFINKNMLEVSAGVIPMLSYYIDVIQGIRKKGSITAIDPTIIDQKIGNISTIRSIFTVDTDLSSYDAIIGLRACEAIEPIVLNCNQNSREFCIALCGCLDDCSIEFENIQEKIDYIYEMVYYTVPDNFEIFTNDFFHGRNTYPVIGTKKKR